MLRRLGVLGGLLLMVGCGPLGSANDDGTAIRDGVASEGPGEKRDLAMPSRDGPVDLETGDGVDASLDLTDGTLAIDFLSIPDLALVPDLAQPPDSAAPPDLATVPDLTISPDLTAFDYAAPPDETTLDLADNLDLTVPDLLVEDQLVVSDLTPASNDMLGVTRWLSVSAGVQTCAIKPDNSLWCWGRNAHGQLGDGTTTERDLPSRVGADTDWAKVSSRGGEHVCAIRTNGTLWCWGRNDSGELGLGGVSTADRWTPMKVGTETDWQTVSANGSYSCGVRGNGTLWCWGTTYVGQLGDGTIAPTRSPKQVGSESSWSSVDAAGGSTFGSKVDGSLWGWGGNSFGELGIGTNAPTLFPALVSGGTDWLYVVGGGVQTFAIRNDRTLWAWGENQTGTLDIGLSWTNQNSPIQSGSAGNWIDFSANLTHHCGVRMDGTAWCWGENGQGELGNGQKGSSFGSATPVQVESDIGWAAISAGNSYSCGLKIEGTLWCWGDNTYGQLGIGTSGGGNVRTTPTLVH